MANFMLHYLYICKGAASAKAMPNPMQGALFRLACAPWRGMMGDSLHS